MEKGVPEEIEADEYDCLDGRCAHFLLVYGGVDAGAVRLMRKPEGRVKVQRFCIQKEFRRLGLGRAAMELIEDYCRASGVRSVEADAKLRALPFYEKCGYGRASDVFIEAGVEHVKVVRRLLGDKYS